VQLLKEQWKMKNQALDKIADEIRVCEKCNLCKGRINAVPGDGSYDAKILFIGEGPGKAEDLQGKPFVGAAGKLLNKLLESIGLKREDVFITNVVKCRPPENRDPLPEEVDDCWPYLDAQVNLIKPDIIVTLGRHSMERFLPGLKISEAHGQAKTIQGKFSEQQIIFPMYHPAAALYNPNLREELFNDIAKLPILIKNINNDS